MNNCIQLMHDSQMALATYRLKDNRKLIQQLFNYLMVI